MKSGSTRVLSSRNVGPTGAGLPEGLHTHVVELVDRSRA